jgi:hypothetical protein
VGVEIWGEQLGEEEGYKLTLMESLIKLSRSIGRNKNMYMPAGSK